jgi:uncharacterized protein (DUF58 family)
MSFDRMPRRQPATVARRIILPREGLYWLGAIVALWAVGWIKGINLILFLSYLLLALWALNWWLVRRSLRGLAVQRVPPGPIFVGTPTAWHVDVAGDGRRPLSGWDLHDESPAHAARWFVATLAPGERSRLRRELFFEKRGTIECQPLRAVTSYPFGLVRQEVRFETNDRLVVYPSVGTLNLQRLRRWLMQASRPDERQHRTRRRLTQEVEFHGLRTFRPGDSPRWIHWRTSARRGELMVREFDQGSHYDLLLIVEAFEPARGPSHLESALSLASTIVWEWARDGGDRVVLAVAARESIIVATRDGRDPVGGVLTCLADVRGAAQPDLEELASKLDRIALPAGPALLVSSHGEAGRNVAHLSARLGRPIAFLDAANPPDFYVPPSMVEAT